MQVEKNIGNEKSSESESEGEAGRRGGRDSQSGSHKVISTVCHPDRSPVTSTAGDLRPSHLTKLGGRAGNMRPPPYLNALIMSLSG